MHAAKSYKGRRRIDPLILHLNTRKVIRWQVVSFKTQPIYSRGQELSYPLKRRLDGSQSWSICFGEDTNPLPLPKIKPQIVHHHKIFNFVILTNTTGMSHLKVVHHVAMLLYWLCYPSFLEWKLFKINLTIVVTHGSFIYKKDTKTCPCAKKGKII